ncbi:adaptor protein MecA [Sporolactobacillus shoreae]|uniref:Adapter protein MecA n=1 Tax=Sporolactobacillus shoreae TaxID=1465501 RepID=A0A4Z0GHI8_9BACL|nr:adaptor protein MecA [Sporolactobacillus shoreae]TGA95973.1 adaptor protein MecA [Sporolactobacillus shoreae]
MKIERINEYTLKFYISYLDIEDRGFDREEIWYNRDRSEELFWQMMDEAHSQESFSLEGPLWIQVQALEKGMEILVTRAKVSKDGNNLQLPVSPNKHLDIPISKNSGKDDGEEVEMDEGDSEDTDEKTESDGNESDERSRDLTFIIKFDDFEDLISLSHAMVPHDQMSTSLYTFRGKYYLNVSFSEDLPDDLEDDDLSKILEFGLDTSLTEFVLQEYGKELMLDNALQMIKTHFPLIL